MDYPELLELPSEHDYRNHFYSTYCQRPITTFDGISVRFRKENFKHAFFESVKGGHDNQFSEKRAKRINWIKATLEDCTSELYQGWDKGIRCYTDCRRVAVVKRNYVVVIEIIDENNAYFITAYVADTPSRPGIPSTLDKIKKGPKWLKQKNR